MAEEILFIENPHSGTLKSVVNEEILRARLRHTNWSLVHTRYPGHAREIAEKAIGKFSTVIAIGGDGTINEIASVLVNSDVTLGILPKGSGNGLSRFLKIPQDTVRALEVIKFGKLKKIDTMTFNGHTFVNMAGVGFDGHISHLFKNFGTRGFVSYSRLVLAEFRKYQSLTMELSCNGEVMQLSDVFVLSLANSSQYGNNAHIAPFAVIDDGLMDICIVKKFSLLRAPVIALKMFNGTLGKLPQYNSFKAPKVRITSDRDMKAHLDGEPILAGQEATVNVYTQSLRVLVP